VTPPINGWRIFVHQDLDAQISKIGKTVAGDLITGQVTELQGPRQKFLKAMGRAMREVIPARPGAAEHRLGRALGNQPEVWFRVKFLQQYRLFYRYDSVQKVIVYVWVNDEESLRAYGSKTDAYALFQKMLASGYPPESFEELLKQSREI
jgi:toxin YhaV